MPKISRPPLAATLLAAALAITPIAFAHAQSGSMTNSKLAEHASRVEEHTQSIDERIADLHAELKITPAEEADWKAVAQTMRDNAQSMQKLAQEKAAQAQNMTAVQDLQTYGEFAQAHVDELKKLTAVFDTLYSSMPDDQKKLADAAFARAHKQDQSTAR